MNLLNTLIEYRHRIPEATLAFILGAVTFRVYLSFVKDTALKRVLADKLWVFVLFFLVVTRFSGLILHPGNLFGLNLFQILSGPPANGWVLGLLVSSIFSTWVLYKERAVNIRTLYILTTGLLLASVPVFLYKLSFDLNPYRLQEVIRLGLTVLLLLANLPGRIQGFFRTAPQRLWLAEGVLLLATSVITPQINKWLVFSSGQWVEVLLIMLALLAEALGDMGRKNQSTG